MKQWVFMLGLSLSAFAGTSTLTGRITDSQGNPLNGTLVMSLPVPAQDPTTSTAIAPSPVFFRVSYGQISGTAPLYDVNTITPSGLYYVARAYNTQGMLQFYGNYVVTGATFDLGAATPTSITTSNISYLSPGFTNGNNTWTGINVFTQTVFAPAYASNSALPALTGFLRLETADQICWRNNANSTDLCLNKNTADLLNWPGNFSITGNGTAGGTFGIGGGTPLATSNQSGTGSICLTTNCQLVTPALNGVTISGTPSVGQTITATSPTAANWQTPAASPVKAIVNVASCALALNNGEWNCTGTITWGVTLSSTTYYADCAMSVPQPTGSYAIPAGFQAKFYWNVKSTTTMTYAINDDHSGSSGATYNLTCTAIE